LNFRRGRGGREVFGQLTQETVVVYLNGRKIGEKTKNIPRAKSEGGGLREGQGVKKRKNTGCLFVCLAKTARGETECSQGKGLRKKNRKGTFARRESGEEKAILCMRKKNTIAKKIRLKAKKSDKGRGRTGRQ